MKRWVPWVTGIFLLAQVTGCGHMGGYLDIIREGGMSPEYVKALEKWSRSQIIHSQFETKAHIGATYRSQEFNRAYLQEYARIYQLGEGELKKQDELFRTMAADFTEFMVYASIPEKTSNDFDRRGSIWRIFLISGTGERIDPVSVRRIDPITPLITEFFPYVNPYYGIAYQIQFPPSISTAAVPLKLVFTGVIGTVELVFGGP